MSLDARQERKRKALFADALERWQLRSAESTQEGVDRGIAAANKTQRGIMSATQDVKEAFRKRDDTEVASRDPDDELADFLGSWTQIIDEEYSPKEGAEAPKDSEGKPIESPFNIPETLLGKKGTGSGKIVSWSYYNDPIPQEGFTRDSGGAPIEEQKKNIKLIIETGRMLEATNEEIAMALSIARVESGFNPFAAAKSSSAYGLGQFINDTGTQYGLNQDNRDDVRMQAQALIELTQDNATLAKKRGKGVEYIYKYHHDGPNKNQGGLAISRNEVMPFYPKYLELVESLQ